MSDRFLACLSCGDWLVLTMSIFHFNGMNSIEMFVIEYFVGEIYGFSHCSIF